MGRWAGFFGRLNIDLPSGPIVVSSACTRWRPGGSIRSTTRVQISVLTLARMVTVISSSMANPGTFSDVSIRRSGATLIRSGGLFFANAASATALAATARTRGCS
ncbi:hypothetical protein [Streptosporangium sp. NBC_01756]|uniref:hypothetical protein n=1 Tax=Streptosporangium sp. NBC_01756 TaxID=2975950 RepID=UPI002DDA6C8F|nr:hypothetical protein [Streptosporangium sp. NBC_01756]WSC86456.1 hypothetical protein OIE48_39940 [Streptosporangium sp. NBC_01756]